MKWTILAALLAVAGVSDASAQTRSLRWSRLAITAHLDGDGRLHVEERHAMVFDGDWNGGERRFRSTGHDEIRLDRLSRVDESGATIPLHRDDALGGIDAFAWTDSETLRWRSRLPSDPPFQQRQITYVLEYIASKILVPADGLYRLDHNFGLPELEWPIDTFSVDLSADPVWEPLDPLPPHIARSNLPRGENVTVTARLRRAGATLPGAVEFGAPASLVYALLALLLAGAAFFARQFWKRERAVGRFVPLHDPASIDRAWLSDHVFKFPPEVVGALWDDRTSGPEVAAVIARLVQEGKLSSRIENPDSDPELVLTLLRPRDSFEGYEAALVSSLFVAGDTTSSSIVKRHYKSTGFDPVAKIRKPLDVLMKTLAGAKGADTKNDWRWTLVLVLAGLSLLGFAVSGSEVNAAAAVVAGVLLFVFYLVALAGAALYRRHLSNLVVRSIQFVPGILLILAVPANMLLRDFRLDGVVLAGAVGLALAFVRSVLNQARIRDAADRLANRRRFTAARNYFKHELRGPNPALDDAWFPYVLAFGLAKNADRWFRSFGGASSARTTPDSSRESSWSSTPSSGSNWSGFGGGASGGAGASGAWAVAATSLASGVASPSSSSSGGSSGGGSSSGGSSGGGGGGGW